MRNHFLHRLSGLALKLVFLTRIVVFSACIDGYYMSGSTCTVCQADHYKYGTNTDSSCSACATGHSTNGTVAQTACTCKYLATQ